MQRRPTGTARRSRRRRWRPPAPPSAPTGEDGEGCLRCRVKVAGHDVQRRRVNRRIFDEWRRRGRGFRGRGFRGGGFRGGGFRIGVSGDSDSGDSDSGDSDSADEDSADEDSEASSDEWVEELSGMGMDGVLGIGGKTGAGPALLWCSLLRKTCGRPPAAPIQRCSVQRRPLLGAPLLGAPLLGTRPGASARARATPR